MAATSSVPPSRISAPRETRSPPHKSRQRQAPRRRFSDAGSVGSIGSIPASAPTGLTMASMNPHSPTPPPELPSYLQGSRPVPGTNGVPQLSRKFVARRISEGETGRLKEELKCQACGKGYKHVSSLAKHLWEHTPEWNLTSKLLISKHQQVQLLEAASILVSMNEEDEDELNETNDQINTAAGDSSADTSEEAPTSTITTTTANGQPETKLTSPITPELDPDESPSPAMDTSDDATTLTNSGSVSTRDIPLASGRAISKAHHVPHSVHLSVGSYHRSRRVSTNLGTSPAIASSLLSMAQASPIPESAFRNRDRSHMPPASYMNRNSSTPENDDDELEDPSHPSHQADTSKDLGVFGDMDD